MDAELRQAERAGDPRLGIMRMLAVACPLCGVRKQGEGFKDATECCCMDCHNCRHREGRTTILVVGKSYHDAGVQQHVCDDCPLREDTRTALAEPLG